MLSRLGRAATGAMRGDHAPATCVYVADALRQWSAACQAAGLAAAAAPPVGERVARRRRSRGASKQQPDQAAGGAYAAADRRAWLVGRFKSRAHGNDAAGAEYFFRAYVQQGGEPQHWMLPMLLGTYGRLRQADKAWAIYERLLELEESRQGGREVAPAAAADGNGPGAAAGPGRGEAWQPGPGPGPGPASAAQPTHSAQRTQQEGQGAGGGGAAGWQARLAARRAALGDEAAQLVAGLRLDAAPLTHYTYSALLTALSRAEHPPYDLPPEYAARAAAAFGEMQRRGLQPNLVLWHNLLDCQAKAGQADAALATYAAMRAAGCRPTTWTFSMLAAAAGRAGRPELAARVVQQLMPQAGLRPNVAVWNAVLGAYGRAGSVDSAYAAWLDMLEAGAVPDDCTERVLALAFGSHPALAAEVVFEARQVRRQRGGQLLDAAAEGAPAEDIGGEAAAGPESAQPGGDGAAGDGGGGGTERRRRVWDRPYRLHHHRQPQLAVDSLGAGQGLPKGVAAWGGQLSISAMGVAGGGGGAPAAGRAPEAAGVDGQRAVLRDALLLDLHGSSQAAARMVLLRRLEALVHQLPALEAAASAVQQQVQQQQEQQQQGQQREREEWESGSDRHGGPAAAAGGLPLGLVVVTGLGRHSRGGSGGVLKQAVQALLRQQGLPAESDPSNDGVVLVPWDPLLAYLRAQRSAMSTDRFLSAARLRYLYILSGVGSLLAAAHLLPRLAPWMS